MDNDFKPFICDWWYVSKDKIPSSFYDYLTLKINDGTDEIVEIPIWTETVNDDGNVILSFPRYCEYGKIFFDTGGYIDGRTDGEDINFNMTVQPRDNYQINAINALVASDHGICQAKTAFGKTYVAINVISKLKKKTLILVHKTPLAEQWKNDILSYTDLNPDDIQILKGTKLDFSKPITISTVQNFVCKNNNHCWELRNKMIAANFGITFYDEVHVTAGPSAFMQSSRWFGSKRVFGLSATPVRGDEYDKIIKWTVGDVIYKDERPMLPVYLAYVPVPSQVPMNYLRMFQFCDKSYMLKYLKWFEQTKMYKIIVTKLLVDLIKMDKKILAVGAFKFLLDDVFKWVSEELINQKIPVSKIIQVHGTSDAKLLDLNSNEQSCVISTNKYFSDGLSVAWLDTLVYLTPPSSKSMVNIPQIVGRIVRTYEGKQYVTVYDIYNNSYDVENGRKLKRDVKYKEFLYHIIDTKTENHAAEMENIIKNVENEKL